MTTESTFQLSTIAAEIRKTDTKYAVHHDDWICLAERCDDISKFVNLDKIDWNEVGEVGPHMKKFLESVYAKRKTLLDRCTLEAQLAYDELKSRVTTLLTEDTELKKCLALASDGVTNAFGMITTIETLRVAIVGYYKLKSDGDENDPGDQGKHCIQLGEAAFLSIKALLKGTSVPDEVFSEETEFIKGPLQAFSKLFASVKPAVRTELIERFGKMMKGLFSCFVLYRLPVRVAEGEDPVFPARFIPAVVLGPYLELFGLNMGSFVVTP